MRAVVQRVKEAHVEVNSKQVGKIKHGLLIYLCVCSDDTEEDIKYLAKKIAHMRIFADEKGKFNLSVQDVKGSCLVISQFTLAADTKKGNRPSYFYAADPQKAKEFYEKFSQILENNFRLHTETGIFAAHMDVYSINDGPVTIFIDTKQNLAK